MVRVPQALSVQLASAAAESAQPALTQEVGRPSEPPKLPDPSLWRVPLLLAGQRVTPAAGLPPPAFASFNAFVADNAVKRYDELGTLLVLTRHGVSLFNRFTAVNGSDASPLLEEGRDQARELARTLSMLPPVRGILTSPLERAERTAEILQASLSYPVTVTVEPGLAEMERGVLAGRPKNMTAAEADAWAASLDDPAVREDLIRRYGLTPGEMGIVVAEIRRNLAVFKRLAAESGLGEDEFARRVGHCEANLDCRPPLGDSFRDGARRIHDFVTGVVAGLGEGTHVLESHGLPLKLLMMELLGVSLTSVEQLGSIPQEFCGITVLWRPRDSTEWKLLVFNSLRDGT